MIGIQTGKPLSSIPSLHKNLPNFITLPRESALDAMLRDPNLPDALVRGEVKTVVAEHIYPEHAARLKEIDYSEIATHLTDTAFGNSGKAFNYLQFLRACVDKGIAVIAADTKEIYRPSGVNINTYNQTDRLELLNENIEKLCNTHKAKGKMLIILGAAHSNHLNATESRSQMGIHQPRYKTLGVTDVVRDSQELIVVTNRPPEEGSDRVSVHSIREGAVFQVEV